MNQIILIFRDGKKESYQLPPGVNPKEYYHRQNHGLFHRYHQLPYKDEGVEGTQYFYLEEYSEIPTASVIYDVQAGMMTVNPKATLLGYLPSFTQQFHSLKSKIDSRLLIYEALLNVESKFPDDIRALYSQYHNERDASEFLHLFSPYMHEEGIEHYFKNMLSERWEKFFNLTSLGLKTNVIQLLLPLNSYISWIQQVSSKLAESPQEESYHSFASFLKTIAKLPSPGQNQIAAIQYTWISHVQYGKNGMAYTISTLKMNPVPIHHLFLYQREGQIEFKCPGM